MDTSVASAEEVEVGARRYYVSGVEGRDGDVKYVIDRRFPSELGFGSPPKRILFTLTFGGPESGPLLGDAAGSRQCE